MVKKQSNNNGIFLAVGSFILIMAGVNNNLWLALLGTIIIILNFVIMKKYKNK